jgi:hypothetical protein
VQRIAADLDVERAADDPEHSDERDCGEKRRGYSECEIDRRVGCDAGVLADTVFGVLVVARNEVEMVVAPVREPAVERMEGEPFPPASSWRISLPPP